MDQLLITNVLLDGKITDVSILNGKFAAIGESICRSGFSRIIDANAKLAILPGFYNTHCHAAMTLLRGYADDMELFRWLNECIWPAEAKLTEEDIYIGSRLAMLEMIKSGTVFFSDMYWHQSGTIRAAEEMKIRCCLGLLFICGPDGELLERNLKNNQIVLEKSGSFPANITLSCAPHAVYTVSKKVLQYVADMAKDLQLPIHIHASETAREVEDCKKQHGMTPIAYLDKIGILNEKTILAHCVHLEEDDCKIIAGRNSVIAHMPVSNMKLCSGAFDLQKALAENCRVTLGTDGCSSNNNLSMLDEMKFAALLAKHVSGDPETGSAGKIFSIATSHGAEAFRLNAGVIAPGKDADAILVELNHPAMVGDHNLIANMVYSADPSVIHSVIVNGNLLMHDHHVPNEEEIISAAQDVCRRIRLS